MERKAIEKMSLNLENLIDLLKESMNCIPKFDQNGKELIIVFGYTGCGKSTMLNSLSFGPESLKK